MLSETQLVGQAEGEDPLELRLMLALAAGYSSLLSWREIDHIQTLVERFSHLADERFWNVYRALGPGRR